MSDPLDELRSGVSSIAADPEPLQRVRRDLMITIEQSVPPTTASSLLLRRRWQGLIAAVAIVMTTTAAWAITRGSSDTTVVQCPTGIMDAVTGDPVADCSNEWRRLNADDEAPAMIGYDNGSGGVTVLIASEVAPPTGR